VERVRMVVVAGTTATAAIDGISAAGADPDLRTQTPSADLEIVETGRPAPDSPVPVSPTGCPTPAVVTRAVRELLGPDSLPVAAVDAGLDAPTAAAVRERIAAVTDRLLAERPGDGESVGDGESAGDGENADAGRLLNGGDAA